MTRDDRFYAFIVARTSRSRSHIRRICVHKRWLKASGLVLFAVMCGLVYGFYGLTQQAAHFRIERENQRLRAENEQQRHREVGEQPHRQDPELAHQLAQVRHLDAQPRVE